MPRPRLHTLLGLTLVLLSMQACASRPIRSGECPESGGSNLAIHDLISARTVTELKQARSMLPPGRSFDHAYALRMNELGADDASDELVIRTIPTSYCDLWAVYQLLCENVSEDGHAVDWFRIAAKAIQRQKRGLDKFLLMQQWLDGAASEDWAPWVDWLRRSDTAAFAATVDKLPRAVREEICTDESCSWPYRVE